MGNIKEVKKVNITNNKCHCCNNEAAASVMDIKLCNDCISLFDRYRKEIRDKEGIQMICDVYTLNQFKDFCKRHNVKNTFANFIVWKDKYRGK